jgi:hypothetical protein
MSFSCSIAFYNLENLFDPEDGEHTLDRKYTPQGVYAWGPERYRRKIENLGLAISQIGAAELKGPPVVMGVCEVENSRCLEDLVQCDSLREYDYGFVHYESNDRRGLDTALLYQKSHFRVFHSRAFNVTASGKSKIETTRSILHVEGELCSQRLHILVNHWPSKREGSKSTQSRRREAALQLNRIVDSIYLRDPMSKILITGDFNDEPNGRSLRKDFSHEFTNTLTLADKGPGTARYRNKWILFDQILLNDNLLNSKILNYRDSFIFNPSFLVQQHGRFKGGPKRTFAGRYHQGGFSDHFPVYAIFEACH